MVKTLREWLSEAPPQRTTPVARRKTGQLCLSARRDASLAAPGAPDGAFTGVRTIAPPIKAMHYPNAPRRPSSAVNPIDPSHYSVLTAMITPAFFLTATGSLLISSNGRLARVVDRMREDLAHMKQTAPGPERTALEAQVAVHRRRSNLVLLSLRLLYVR